LTSLVDVVHLSTPKFNIFKFDVGEGCSGVTACAFEAHGDLQALVQAIIISCHKLKAPSFKARVSNLRLDAYLDLKVSFESSELPWAEHTFLDGPVEN